VRAWISWARCTFVPFEGTQATLGQSDIPQTKHYSLEIKSFWPADRAFRAARM